MTTGVVVWTGNPDCQSAHDWLLAWLQARKFPFLAQPPSESNTRIQGNVAETLSMCLALNFRRPTKLCFPANAQHPFSNISRPDIDLLWIGFGTLPSDDYVVVQEIKSTGGDNLNYADTLLTDYDKLFARDPQFTLQTRLQAIQTELEMQNAPYDLLARIAKIAGTSPQTSGNGVRLIPTLVHDLNSISPTPKMLGISATLTGRGWNNVEPWAIGMTDLLARFRRLATGAN